MRYVGVSEHFHDASICVLENGNIQMAYESERFSKLKHDSNLHSSFYQYFNSENHIVYSEDWETRVKHNNHVFLHGKELYPSIKYDQCFSHHLSHCTSAFYTRPWKDTTNTICMSIDGSGEWQTAVVYDNTFNILYEETLPRSIGIFYAIVTDCCGFRVLSEEYAIMSLAAYGEPHLFNTMKEFYYNQKITTTIWDNDLKTYSFIKSLLKKYKLEDVAASVQKLAEYEVVKIANIAKQYGNRLVYSGGVAQNILANNKIVNMFDEVWIDVNPGDAGLSLGAAAHSWGSANNKNKINYTNPYLGYDIDGDINVKKVVDHLYEYSYCGIANGRAEFSPRALGNRSLIADPRRDVKDTVNQIKRRQNFRPFAPAILEEYADKYFEGPMNEYMQFAAIAKHDYNSVIHIDGTSRVQLVKKNCKSILRDILELWYDKTKCPMLLNTSLNVRGMPMVNDSKDADIFQKRYKVKVFK